MADASPPIDFDAVYRGTPPPWDIGRAQAGFQALFATGRVSGRVLDVGCGTGEHALLAASLGLDATGIDAAPSAIAIAKRKAQERGVSARFVVGDALDLATLGERFDSVLDCGLFHLFDDSDRERYLDGLSQVIARGGCFYMLCFSDRLPADFVFGPRRVSEDEIRRLFREGWRVDSIEASTIETTLDAVGVSAWLASITRVE